MRSLVLASLLLPALASAQVPGRLPYQGRLLRADGSPESGVVQMRFAVFAVPSGGSELWSEDQSLALAEGFYAALLGEATPLAAGLFDGSDRYLEVSVGGQAFTPRQRIASVPYALTATDARNVVGGDVSAASLTVKGQVLVDSSGRLEFGQLKSCAEAGQILKWDGQQWACAKDAGGMTSVAVSAPLSGSGTPESPLALGAATGSADGYLKGADFARFDAKLDGVDDSTVAASSLSGDRLKAGTLPADRLAGPLGDAWLAGIGASKVTGQLTDAQIASLAASKVTGQLTDAQIAALSAAKLTGKITDAQIEALAAGKLTGKVVDGQIESLSSSKITGPLVVPIASGAPSNPALGTLYFDSGAKELRFWDGVRWAPLHRVANCGDDSSRPAKSCKAIRDNCPGLTSNTYWLKPTDTANPIRAWCDLSGNDGGWTLCANFIDTTADDLRFDVSYFQFGSDWAGFNGTPAAETPSLTSAGTLNCTALAQALGAKEVRFECTSSANSAGNSANWSSGPVALGTTPTLVVGTDLTTQRIQGHGEYAWGGYNHGSWVVDESAYPNCASNSCGVDGTRFATNINIELAGGYDSPGCASGCGANPRNYTGAEEGVSCGGVNTQGVAGERYSIFIR